MIVRLLKAVLRSRSRIILFGAGAVTLCDSGSSADCSGYELNVLSKWIIKMTQRVTLLFPFTFVTILFIPKSEGKVSSTIRLTLLCFLKVGLVYSRVGAGAGAGAALKFLLRAGAAEK
jgi:hypothetical protein